MQPATGVYDVWEYTDTGEVSTLEGQQISVP